MDRSDAWRVVACSESVWASGVLFPVILLCPSAASSCLAFSASCTKPDLPCISEGGGCSWALLTAQGVLATLLPC